MIVRRRLVPLKHSEYDVPSVSCFAASWVHLMSARCFSAEISPWPRRCSALLAASSFPCWASHHGDLYSRLGRRQGLDLAILLRNERHNDKGGEAEPQLSKKDTPVSPAVRS